MSDSLTESRQNLRQVNIYVKQGKIIAAIQAIRAALHTMLTTPLLKSERVEFSELITDSLYVLSSDPLVRQVFPIAIKYTPGEEEVLIATITEMQKCFSEFTMTQAKQAIVAKEEKKLQTLERGKAELAINIAKGRAILVNLARAHPEDAELMGTIGEIFLRAKLYEDAVDFLNAALDLREDIASLYNSIGIALRELKQYELAQTYYLRATKFFRNDPNLFFNIARLYLDWQKFEKARQATQVALKLDKDFEPAQKLLLYIEKKVSIRLQS